MFSKSDFSDHVKFWTYDSGMSPAVYASNVPDPQYMEAIGQQDYTKGRAPLETLPAQWWNWLLNGETDRFNNLWSYTTYLIDEINNLLDLVGEVLAVGNNIIVGIVQKVNKCHQIIVRACDILWLYAANHCREEFTLLLPFE